MKWFNKNKKTLINFGFISLLNLFLTIVTVNLFAGALPDLKQYQITGNITSKLQVFSVVGMINMLLMIVWVTMFIYLMLKTIFVNKEQTKKIFFFDELAFLKNLPNELKKGIDRNE